MEDITENEQVQTIGEMLKNARIKQNKSIDEVAEELCVRKFYLTAIENMDIANIPPMPYGLGFVRSYAKLLGLNSDRIVASYKQVITGEDETPPHSESRPEVSTPKLKHFILGIIGLALLAVAWSVLPTTSKFEDTIVVENDTATVPEPLIVSEAEENEEIADKSSEKASEEGKVKTEETGKEAAAENKDDKTEKSEASAEKVVLPQMKLVLNGPSWLELKQGQKVLLSGIYNKGYKYDIPSEEGLIITVGKPGNVRFLLDGKPIVVATARNRKNISLDTYFKKQD